MISAVHALTQLKARISIMAVVVYSVQLVLKLPFQSAKEYQIYGHLPFPTRSQCKIKYIVCNLILWRKMTQRTSERWQGYPRVLPPTRHSYLSYDHVRSASSS
jgi:hypothetical protein